jgi:hypothetical protein
MRMDAIEMHWSVVMSSHRGCRGRRLLNCWPQSGDELAESS